MKRKKVLILLLCVIMLIAMSACGGDDKNGDAENDGSVEGYSGIVPINTQTSGNTSYVLSAGVANMINKDKEVLPNVQFSAEAIGGDVAVTEQVIERYESGLPALGTTTTWASAAAHDGRMPEVGGAHKELKAVLALDPSAIHLVVPADSKIQTYADLKGTKIGGFAPGIGPMHYVEDLLSTQFGIESDDYSMIPLDNKDRLDSLANKSVDGVFLLGAVPASLVMEAVNTSDVRVVPLEESILKEFTTEFPYYSYTEIPAGTYKGNDEETMIGTIGMMLVSHEKTPDEIVYELVKAIIEQPDEIKQIHPSYDINLDNATAGITFPFHSGAIKYFKEKGLNIE